MRLVTVQPAFFYGDLDEHAYSCECGGAATAFVRQTLEGHPACAAPYILRKAPSSRPNQRVYAVGDVVTDLRQLTVATGHAAVAATNIHNRLAANFRSYPSTRSVLEGCRTVAGGHRNHRISGLK